ncbi:DsbE family thiol:disulfide interchange protein [Candidatus Pelagibacter sp.]|nr:DsbE family thiol:disulfide interchange protein [Candidatus Pelagibacter sp.]
MKNKFNLLFLVLFIGFCFTIFYKGLNNSNTYTPKFNKKSMPIFNIKEFNSNNYINSEKVFEGSRYYILNIWASWCVPCREEHPWLMELSKNQSIKLIGLNYKDDLTNAKKFVNKFGNPYSQNLIDDDGTIAIEFGAYGVPETFVINEDKIIIKKFVGPINQKIFKEIQLIIK